MIEDFLYSRCAECHKLIHDNEFCAVFVSPYYLGDLPYLHIAEGLIYRDGLPYYLEFDCFMEEIFKFFERRIYIKCLGCSVVACNKNNIRLAAISKKEFMVLEPRLHNRIVGFSFISG